MSIAPKTIEIISNYTWCSVSAFLASSRYLLIFSFSFITTWWSWDTVTAIKYHFLASFSLIVMTSLVCLTFPLISTSHSISTLLLAEVDTFSGIWPGLEQLPLRPGLEQLLWWLLFPFSYILSLAIFINFHLLLLGYFLFFCQGDFSLWTPYFRCHVLSSGILPLSPILTRCFTFSFSLTQVLLSSLCIQSRLFVSATTHSSKLSNLLPPSHFFEYSLPTFSLGCSAPFINIIFCIQVSILLKFCIVQFIMPALHGMTPTAHMSILSITFFEYSFDSSSFLTLLRYSSSNFSFIYLCLIWSSCSKPKDLYPAVSISFISSLSAVSIRLNASFFLATLSPPYTCPCLMSYLHLERIFPLCLLKSLVLFHSSHIALGQP